MFRDETLQKEIHNRNNILGVNHHHTGVFYERAFYIWLGLFLWILDGAFM